VVNRSQTGFSSLAANIHPWKPSCVTLLLSSFWSGNLALNRRRGRCGNTVSSAPPHWPGCFRRSVSASVEALMYGERYWFAYDARRAGKPAMPSGRFDDIDPACRVLRVRRELWLFLDPSLGPHAAIESFHVAVAPTVSTRALGKREPRRTHHHAVPPALRLIVIKLFAGLAGGGHPGGTELQLVAEIEHGTARKQCEKQSERQQPKTRSTCFESHGETSSILHISCTCDTLKHMLHDGEIHPFRRAERSLPFSPAHHEQLGHAVLCCPAGIPSLAPLFRAEK